MLIPINLVKMLKDNNMTISFAESCTGGLLVSKITQVPGASNVLNESYVTYSEEAKQRILIVKKETLDKYTVYSKEVAHEMVYGLKEISNANVCVSVTGIAGCEKEENDKPYYFSILINDEYHEYAEYTDGTRLDSQEKMAKIILYQVSLLLQSYIKK